MSPVVLENEYSKPKTQNTCIILQHTWNNYWVSSEKVTSEKVYVSQSISAKI